MFPAPHRIKLQWIQILRAVAASAVVLHHSIYYGAARDDLDTIADHVTIFASGVDLFFVISGFVMMMVSDHTAGRQVTARQFVISRIVRIVPLYWMYTILVALIFFSDLDLLRSVVASQETILYSMIFIPYRGDAGIAPILGVGWTLNYEMWFYATFALLIAMPIWRRVAMMGLIFAVLFAIGNQLGGGGEVAAYLDSSITFEFLAGMALYGLYRRGFRLTPPQVALLLCVAAVLFAWSAINGDPASAARFPVWGVPAAAVVFASLSLPEVKGGAGRLLVLLGDASYSIYLSHLFTIGAVYAANRHLLGLGLVPMVIVSFAAALVVGVIAYRVLELPLLRASRYGVRRLLQHSA